MSCSFSIATSDSWTRYSTWQYNNCVRTTRSSPPVSSTAGDANIYGGHEATMPYLQRPYNRMKETRTQPSTSKMIGSVVSNHLHHVSSNLQRLPPQLGSHKHGLLDRPTVKRRRLEMNRMSTLEDDYLGGAIPATLCVPSASHTTALGQCSNLSAQVHPETDHFSESMIKSHHVAWFRKEIRMELLEIVDKLNEIDESHSLMDAEFEVCCTLEIFIAKYEETPDGMRLRCGEDLCRDQQIGTIRTICDGTGHCTTRVWLPRPFLISAEDLFVKKRSKAMNNVPGQYYYLGMAEQYVVKIWLEAPNSASRWPPLELESALDPNGKLMKRLREGTFSTGDIRLSCKGILFPEGGVCNSLDMALKLGGFQIQTNYTVKLDVQYSVPLQGVESPGEDRQPVKTQSPDIAIRTLCLPSSEAADIYMEDGKRAENISQRPREPAPLIVPEIKRRLCDAVSKHILTPGEELHGMDDNLETCWRTAKHVEMIQNRPDISADANDYIIKWDSYVNPLGLSTNFYVPQILLRFVEENRAWFAKQPCRMREFSLHATSLRLRGSINTECFAKCITLLQDCNRLNIAPYERPQETPVENVVEDAAGEEAANEDALKEVAVYEEEVKEALDGGAISEEETNAEAKNEEVADEDEVHGDRMNKDTAGNIQILTPERDATNESADEEATYEDAREDPESLTMDDFFDVEDSGVVLQQPFYFQSCWQSITQRWPRLSLHSPENFGIATVLGAIAIFQGFPNDNIDRLIALYIHYCPNENIEDLVDMYYNANNVVPEVPGVCMTELKLHRIMWEASRETCEDWLTDVYRLEGGTRRTVQEAIETATNADAWEELWERIAQECSG